MDKSGETVVTRDEDTSTPRLANRLFVEFYIPPPPSDTTESESSESETTTQDGGFEINGLGSAVNIFDVGASHSGKYGIESEEPAARRRFQDH